ncbi:MAG: PilZ domain-containing protein [Rhodospirillaceae bacterium]|jgi:hypothetical protein|nr:PilZ domain-containing protein [Rhodospirillaceae bacterium]
MMVAPLRRMLLGLKNLAVGSKETKLHWRRDFARADVAGEVSIIFENQTFDGRLCDVSISGAMLVPDFGAPVGAEIELELPNIPGRVQALVKRRSENSVGVQFANPNIGIIIAGWSRGTTPSSMMAASRRAGS